MAHTLRTPAGANLWQTAQRHRRRRVPIFCLSKRTAATFAPLDCLTALVLGERSRPEMPLCTVRVLNPCGHAEHEKTNHRRPPVEASRERCGREWRNDFEYAALKGSGKGLWSGSARCDNAASRLSLPQWGRCRIVFRRMGASTALFRRKQRSWQRRHQRRVPRVPGQGQAHQLRPRRRQPSERTISFRVHRQANCCRPAGPRRG